MERSWYLLALIGALLGVLAAIPTAHALEASSGREDLRITALTTTTAIVTADRATGVSYWHAQATWTDPHGAVHRGDLGVASGTPAGTPVPARLSSDGSVLGPPQDSIDMWTTIAVACTDIGLFVLATLLTARWLLRRVAQRLRHSSWDAAWDSWQPSAPDREGL